MFNCQLLSATLSALTLLAAENVVNATCEVASDCTNYPEFAQSMQDNAGDYTWRSHIAVTSDGYELTMFEITGDANGNQPNNAGQKGQLLLQHGYASSSQSWFNRDDTSAGALPQQLYDAGFSVWLGNTRGAPYSQGHVSFVPYQISAGIVTGFGPDYERYWNFDLDDIAEKDIPAQIEKMQENNSLCKKMTIVSHSQGANVVMNSLSKASKANNYIGQAINLEPCFISASTGLIPGGITDIQLFGLTTVLEGAGVASAFGPLWDQQLAEVCADDATVCAALGSIDSSMMNEVGIKQTEHFLQNDLINDWQAFSNNWFFFFLRDTTDIRPQDVSVKIGVRALWSNQDELCPRARQESANLLRFPSYNPAEDQFIDGPHTTATSLNSKAFVDKVMALVEPDAGIKASRKTCRRAFNFGI